MCRSIYRFSVISSLIFPLVVFNVSASPCFSDNSVTKGTQMISKLPRGLFIFALILVTSWPGKRTNSADSWSDNSWGSSMRDGSEGFGLYTGPENSHIPTSRIDNEDDL